MTPRRKFLAALGTAATAAVAGCSSSIDGATGETVDKPVPAPSVDFSDDWKLLTPNSKPRVFAEGSDFGVDWTAVGHTNRYENVALRNRIKSETMERVDQPMMIAFATQIQFFPDFAHLGTGFQQETIDSKIQNTLTGRMKQIGLENVSYDGKMTNTGVGPAQLMEFSGQYPVEPIPIEDVNIPGVEKDSFTIEGKNLDIAGIAGYKKEGKAALVSGGVYPNGNFTEHKNWNVTGGIDLNLTIDLELQPGEYFDTIRNHIADTSAQS